MYSIWTRHLCALWRSSCVAAFVVFLAVGNVGAVQLPSYVLSEFDPVRGRAIYRNPVNHDLHPGFTLNGVGVPVLWSTSFDHIPTDRTGVFEYCRVGTLLSDAKIGNRSIGGGTESYVRPNELFFLATPLSQHSGPNIALTHPSRSPAGLLHFVSPGRTGPLAPEKIVPGKGTVGTNRSRDGYEYLDVILDQNDFPWIGFDQTQRTFGLYRAMRFVPQNLRIQRKARVGGSGENHQRVCVVIHGWNPNSLTSGSSNTTDGEWLAISGLVSALTARLGNGSDQTFGNFGGWSLEVYDWAYDADTGPSPSFAPDGALPSRNGTEAAEAGSIHGFYLAQLLNCKYPDLEQVQLIAHSAGSWVARSAAWRLAHLQPSLERLQVTLLDGYMPAQNAFSPGGLDDNLGVRQMNDLATGVRTLKPLSVFENYYAEGESLSVWGTQEYIRDFDVNSRVDFGETPALEHKLPVIWYAATALNPMVDPAFGLGAPWSEEDELLRQRGFRDSLMWRDAWGSEHKDLPISELADHHWARQWVERAVEIELTSYGAWPKIDMAVSRAEIALILRAVARAATASVTSREALAAKLRVDKTTGLPFRGEWKNEFDWLATMAATDDGDELMPLDSPPIFVDIDDLDGTWKAAINDLGSFNISTCREAEFRPFAAATIREAVLIVWDFFGFGGPHEEDYDRLIGLLSERSRGYTSGLTDFAIGDYSSLTAYRDGSRSMTRAMFFKLVVNCLRAKVSRGLKHRIWYEGGEQ